MTDMTFLEERFPEHISLGAVSGPGYQTRVVTVTSGFERRNANQDQSRERFQVGLRPRSEEETDDLISFFRMVKGKAYGFRYKDWTDFTVTAARGVLTLVTPEGSPTVTRYQLGKTYGTGVLQETREIRKPVASGLVIYSGSPPGSTALTSGVDYILDPTTGLVQLIGSPTIIPTSWAGEFDVPVRFDRDEMDLQIEDKTGEDADELIINWPSILLVGIRIDDEGQG